MEWLHFEKRRELDALAHTTEEAWENLDSIKLANVWNCWQLVFDLTIEDDVSNRNVESKRGKLCCALPEAKVFEDETEGGKTELELINEADVELACHFFN